MSIPNTLQAQSPAVHPLVAQLLSKHGCTEVAAANFEAFTARPGHALLFFTEDPVKFRETPDLAVILPELMRVFPGRFTAGVLLPEAARAFHARYGFRRWPAYVLLRDGRHAGTIDGIRNWDEYVQAIAQWLEPAAGAPEGL